MADSTLTVQGLTEALRRLYYGISMDRNAPRIAAFAWSWLRRAWWRPGRARSRRPGAGGGRALMDLMVSDRPRAYLPGCRLNGGTFGRDPARGTPTEAGKSGLRSGPGEGDDPRRPGACKDDAGRHGTFGVGSPEGHGEAPLRRCPRAAHDRRRVRTPNAGGEPTSGGAGDHWAPDSTQMEEPVPGPTEPFSLGVNEPPLFGDSGADTQAAGDEETPEDEAAAGRGGHAGRQGRHAGGPACGS